MPQVPQGQAGRCDPFHLTSISCDEIVARCYATVLSVASAIGDCGRNIGVGEVGVNGPLPAIAGAVEDAPGRRVHRADQQ